MTTPRKIDELNALKVLKQKELSDIEESIKAVSEPPTKAAYPIAFCFSDGTTITYQFVPAISWEEYYASEDDYDVGPVYWSNYNMEMPQPEEEQRRFKQANDKRKESFLRNLNLLRSRI
jgi:hypothetical protein